MKLKSAFAVVTMLCCWSAGRILADPPEKATPDVSVRPSEISVTRPLIDTEDLRRRAAIKAINAKWNALGAESGFLGSPYPGEPATKTPNGRGYFRHYNGGSIYWQGGAEAFELHGDIRLKYSALGWENSVLGFPITDERIAPDRIGRFQHFEGGSLYWKPSAGAVLVQGLIRERWGENGFERNPDLGYPIADEEATRAGSHNRYSDFENGVIFWKAGDAHASELWPLKLGMSASRDADEMNALLGEKIGDLLKEQPLVYLRGTVITGVTDYRNNGSYIENRRYLIQVDIGESLPVLSDPTSRLTLELELRLNKDAHAVEGLLRSWHSHTDVPALTAEVISAAEINAIIGEILNAKIGRIMVLGRTPEDLNILSLKVMPDYAMNLYLEPPD